MARICIIPPGNELQSTGNWRTAWRYQRLLAELGHDVTISSEIPEGPLDVAIVLHAVRGAETMAALRRDPSVSSVAVVLTGTDVYSDLEATIESLEFADAIIALQTDAASRVPAQFQDRTHVIFQSATPTPSETRPTSSGFQMCVVANLRAVKDPLLPAHALARLPDSSAHMVLVGAEIDPALAQEARSLSEQDPRFEWLGPCSYERARETIASSHLVVIPSHVEGSSNVLMEALVDGIPVLAARIPGLLGTLGVGYPGFFPVGDAEALAALIRRCESEPAFLSELRESGRELHYRASEERERRELGRLVSVLV